jgi:hypothetical protein
LSASQSLYDDGAVAPVGLTRTPSAVCSHPITPKRCGPVRLWGLRAVAPPTTNQRCRKILSQALAPLQSLTYAPPCAAYSPALANELCHTPLPRFLSLQRLTSREEPLILRELPPHGLCCVLGVSHPFDALLPSRPSGLVSSRFRSWDSPFEAFLPSKRRTLSRAPSALARLASVFTPTRRLRAFLVPRIPHTCLGV